MVRLPAASQELLGRTGAADIRRLEDLVNRQQVDLDRAEKEKQSEERIAKLEAELADIREERQENRHAIAQQKKEDAGAKTEDAEGEGDDEVTAKRKAKTRPGRKRGMVYQDEKTGEGYVYDGDDEDDQVEENEEETA